MENRIQAFHTRTGVTVTKHFKEGLPMKKPSSKQCKQLSVKIFTLLLALALVFGIFSGCKNPLLEKKEAVVKKVTIERIEITTNNDPERDVHKKGSLRFAAVVKGQNLPDNKEYQKVIWSIVGSVSDGTTIAPNGFLEVDKDEKSEIIVIRATSEVNTDVSNTCRINVLSSPLSTVLDIRIAEPKDIHRGETVAFRTLGVVWDITPDPDYIPDPNAVIWRLPPPQSSSADSPSIDPDSGVLTVPPTFDWTLKRVRVQVASIYDNEQWFDASVAILEPEVTGISIQEIESVPGLSTPIDRASGGLTQTRDFAMVVEGKGNPNYNFSRPSITVTGEKPLHFRTTASVQEDGRGRLITTVFEQNDELTVNIDLGSDIPPVEATVKLTGAPRKAGDWYFVSIGSNHTIAIDHDGKLWTWGRNHNGQLGNGVVSATNALIPVQIGTDTDWVYASGGGEVASAGRAYNLALKANGELWAWGNQDNGKVGLVDTSGNRAIPGKIESDVPWQTSPGSISAGGAHSLGIKEDGTLWAWGYGANGRLGNMSTTAINQGTPIQIRLYSGNNLLIPQPTWRYVSVGFTHSAAITTDGDLYVWGRNNRRQVGNGNTADQSSPVLIMRGTKWKSVVTGYEFTIAITTDGQLFSWGRSDFAALGMPLQNPSDVFTPKPVLPDIRWRSASISAESNHFAGITEEGHLYLFGRNQWGQIGNNADSAAADDDDKAWNGVHEPFQIKVEPTEARSGLTWSHAWAAPTFTMAINEDDQTLWAWGQNTNGHFGNGKDKNPERNPEPIEIKKP